MASGDDRATQGDAARYHLFTAEQELRKARATGSAQAAAIAQLHALQLGAALAADGGGAAGAAADANPHQTHHHQTRQTHHYLATAPLRAEAAALELAAQAQHDAATGRAVATLAATAAEQADAAAAAAAAGAPATTTRTTTRRAELARALMAAVDFGSSGGLGQGDEGEKGEEEDEEEEDALREAAAAGEAGARAWELSARLEAATAAWEAAQHERRRQEQQRRRQERQAQAQAQQQQAGRAGAGLPPPAPPHQPRGPAAAAAANGPPPPPPPTHHQQHELAARWGGTTDPAALLAPPAHPPAAKRARPADDDPIELGGTSGDEEDGDDDADGADDEWVPGGRGAGGGGGGGHRQQQQQQLQQAAGRRPGGALPGPFATAAAAAAAAAAAGGGAAAAGGANANNANGPPLAGPFQTARLQLVSDLRKKGQHQQAAALQQQQQQAPRPSGLTRRGASTSGGGGNGNGAQGFVPPFVSKAIDSVCDGGGNGGGGGNNNNNRQQQQGGNNNNNNANANANGGGEQQEGPLSARTLELLRVAAAADLPPELARHEPRLLELVCSEVVDPPGAAGVGWDDIAGLATVKALVKEIVVWPMLNPSIFRGARAPPRGLLLFGPPGTGKTLIGRAIASQTGAAFFSISASSLTSKWIGEGEKLVRALFAVAAHLQPSVIFVDEVDSLLSARKAEGEHEASRRLKTELLVQMEGCDPSSSAKRSRVLLVGATNRPEELDEAARRRMPKQLYIPLPCAEARRQMLQRQLVGEGSGVASALDESDLARIVERTEGYSGSDMRALIQEACQGPVRDAVAAHGERVAELSAADLRPVVRRDFAAAARAARASVSREEVARYEQYDARHGAKYVARRDGGLAGGGGGGEEGGAGGGGGKEEEEDDDW